MVSDIEKMMVDDLRGMIRSRVAQTEIDSQISLIDAKLSEAITVVPEFPLTAAFVLTGSLIASIVVLGRLKGTRTI